MTTLVPDVLSIIFDLACDDYRLTVQKAMESLHDDDSSISVERHLSRETLLNPLALSQVCKLWRDAAKITPIIWDTIWLKTSKGVRSRYGREEYARVYSDAAELLATWLDRAGPFPLTIKVEEFLCDTQYFGDGSILRQIFSRSRQWQRLNITCPPDNSTLFSSLLGCLSEPLTTLETCNIRPGYARSLNGATGLQLRAPNLKHISLYRTLDLSVPMTGTLAMLNLDFINQGVLVNYLLAARNLKFCTILLEEPFGNWSQQIVMPNIELPYIREFSLESSYLNHILRALSLPAIEKLTVKAGRENGSALPEITNLLQRSRLPSLSSLHISTQFLYENELIDLLRIIPNLNHLEIRIMSEIQQGPHDTESRVQLDNLNSLVIYGMAKNEGGQLWIPGVNQLLVPALEELELSFWHSPPTRFQLESVSTMILLSNSKLRKLTLTSDHTPDVSLISFVKGLNYLESLYILNRTPRDIGMDIAAGHSPSDIGLTFSGALLTSLLLPSTPEVSVNYLPKLREFFFVGILNGEIQTVIDAFEYRWKGDTTRGVERLDCARFFIDEGALLRDDTTDIYERINTLALEGMDVMLKGTRDI